MVQGNRLYDPRNKAVREEWDTGETEPEYMQYEDMTEPTDEQFHIGDYRGENAKVIKCKTCHGTEFIVAQGQYYTAIKCRECDYEVCIHDG